MNHRLRTLEIISLVESQKKKNILQFLLDKTSAKGYFIYIGAKSLPNLFCQQPELPQSYDMVPQDRAGPEAQLGSTTVATSI